MVRFWRLKGDLRDSGEMAYRCLICGAIFGKAPVSPHAKDKLFAHIESTHTTVTGRRMRYPRKKIHWEVV